MDEQRAVTQEYQSVADAPLARRGPSLPERTVADLIAEVILRGRSPQTRRAYRSDLEDFLVWRVGLSVKVPADPADLRADSRAAHIINATLAKLQQTTEADINTYLAHLSEIGDDGRPACAPATVNRRLTPLRLLFARLLRYHLIAVDPMEYVKTRKTSNASTTVYLTRPQVRTLEEHCKGPTLRDVRDHALLVFMLTSGVRSSEAIGLTIADLGTVDEHRVAWITGKGGARERIKIAPRTYRLLEAYLKQADITEGPVFRRLRPRKRATPAEAQPYAVHGGLSYDGLKFIVQSRFRVAGLSNLLSPHSTRHTFITLAIRGGAPLPMVQTAARHADPRTTMRYARDMDDLDQNAVDYVNW